MARIDSKELSEWMAYYELEPFGHVRTDLNAGIIAATIANVNRGKQGQAYRPADFMPYMENGQQSENDMKAILNSMVGDK